MLWPRALSSFTLAAGCMMSSSVLACRVVSGAVNNQAKIFRRWLFESVENLISDISFISHIWVKAGHARTRSHAII